MDSWIVTYGTPTYLLTDDRAQFINNILESISAILSTKRLTGKAYHPQTNGQAEGINKTIIA